MAFNLSYIYDTERFEHAIASDDMECAVFRFLMKGLWIFIEGNSFIDSLLLLPSQCNTHSQDFASC